MHIITHAGAAHRDEILAIGLILGSSNNLNGQVSIYRRDPTPDELADPGTYVVDVGMRHEPELRNFDHHQLPRDGDPACAFTLVAEFLGIDLLLSQRPWYSVSAMMDSKGPFALAAHLELPRFPKELWSPIESVMAMGFEEFSGDTPVDPFLVEACRYVGLGVIHEAREFDSALKSIRDCHRVVPVSDVAVLVVDSVPNTEALDALRGEVGKHVTLPGVCVCHDDRGAGWMLYRWDDHPRVDFSVLDGRDDIEFAHASGFIAKTKERCSTDEALDLVRLSIS